MLRRFQRFAKGALVTVGMEAVVVMILILASIGIAAIVVQLS